MLHAHRSKFDLKPVADLLESPQLEEEHLRGQEMVKRYHEPLALKRLPERHLRKVQYPRFVHVQKQREPVKLPMQPLLVRVSFPELCLEEQPQKCES